MNQSLPRLAAIIVFAASFALTGCVPIAQQQFAQATAEAVLALPTATVVSGASAVVATKSARVRALPTTGSPQIGSVLEGEEYPVTGRSSDGLWFELEIPKLKGGSGWVATDLVSVTGAIVDLPIFDTSGLPTPEPTEEAASDLMTLLPTVTPEAGAPDASAPGVSGTTATTETTPVSPTVEASAPAPAEAETPAAETSPAETPATEPAVTETPITVTGPAEIALPTATPQLTLTLTETAALTPVVAPGAGLAAINADVRLRVRAEPAADSPIVGFGYRAEVFPVIESSADGLWTHIGGSAESRENPDGGWVATEFLVLGQ